MTSARKSNIKYSVFICISVLLLGIIFAFSSTKQRANSSEDYDRSLDIGGYVVKISGCVYFTDTNEIVFTFKYKLLWKCPQTAFQRYTMSHTQQRIRSTPSFHTTRRIKQSANRPSLVQILIPKRYATSK